MTMYLLKLFRPVAVIAAIFVLCLALVTSSHAVMILHDGSQVASDGFESDTVGAHPSGWTPKDGKEASANVVVADSGPSAAEGSNYLILNRAGNSGSDGRAYLGFSEITSGEVSADFSLYVPSTNVVSVTNSSEGNIGLGPNMAGGLYLGLGQKNASGPSTIDYYDAATSAWVNSGLTYAYDTWQRVTMAVNEDTGDASLSIDGTSASFNIGRTDFTVSRLEIEGGFAGGAGPPHNQLFVDAVPEPTSLGLAGIALLACVAGLNAFRRR